MILQTERLFLRELTPLDFNDLCDILQNETVMYAYEHAFTDEEVQFWLDQQLMRYKENGFGLWALIEKSTGFFVGQAGITLQKVNTEEVLEIGYLLKQKYWHNGFATEAAIGCKNYAFQQLDAQAIYSIIRDNNISSQKVAIRNGMSVVARFTKHYYGIDMPHLVYAITKVSNS